MQKREHQYFLAVRRRLVVAIALGLVALLLWLVRTMVADQFADAYEVRIGLMIQDMSDQERVREAFVASKAQWPNDVSARLAVDPKMWGHPDVIVSAPASGHAVAAAQTIGKAIGTAFDASGASKLSVSIARVAHAVPGATRDRVLAVLTVGAPLLILLAVYLFVVAWRWGRAKGVLMALDGIEWGIALAIGIPVALFMLPGWLSVALVGMAIPGSIAVVIVVKMQQVRRASHWPSAPGRIVRSQLRRMKSTTDDSASTIGNLPDIEYVYTVNGVEHHGKRITIGEFKPDSPEVQAALERYQVGRSGPVFYNPDKPQEAVLERDPPVRPLAMYGIAGGVMMVGLVVLFGFTRMHDFILWLEPHFPPGAIVHAFLFFVVAGFIASMAVLGDLAHARVSVTWPTVAGTVLSSRVEGHNKAAATSNGQVSTVWSPLVEYSYRVGERTYHGSRIAYGQEMAAARRDLAEAVIVRYPEGAAVTVHYDPSNPAHATLETTLAFRWVALLFPIGFFALALFFSGRFHS